MRFLIINLTNQKIPITRTTMEKVVLLPHKPYLMETMHNPEINFWMNCTDTRFRIISNNTEISRYMQVLDNQAKNNTAETTDTDKGVIEVKPEAVTVMNETVSEEIAEEIVDNTQVESVVEYTEDNLIKMKVADLKDLANSLNIQIPNGANKATIIETIIANQ